MILMCGQACRFLCLTETDQMGSTWLEMVEDLELVIDLIRSVSAFGMQCSKSSFHPRIGDSEAGGQGAAPGFHRG